MYFLEHVAADLMSKYGSDLSRLTVVFPNKRASLFLNAHLSRLAGRPVWSPRYMTISELFRQNSRRTIADPIKLVCDMHRTFTELTGMDETLDHFYGWGQMLIADFDDLDKNLADADRVLANLRDIHELDQVDYLSKEQKEAIRRFFSTFSDDHNTLLRERFLRLWSRMADIYHHFNSRLQQQGLAYEGALYREVVESTAAAGETAAGLAGDIYVFVGFNVLLPVEQRLFSRLKAEGKARFYWDFDKYYMKSEAGMFIAKHLADFPNELDSDDDSIYACFATPKSISVVSAPTENVQARYVSQWLGSQHSLDGTPHPTYDTAIVLCDEKLLPAVIHCLPDCVDKINVTTGYPLSQTPAAALINTLFALRTQGWQPNRQRYRLRQVNALLRHPYIADLSPATARLQRELNEQKVYYPAAEQLCADEVTQLLFGSPDAEGAAANQNIAMLQWMCSVMRKVATANNNDNTEQETDGGRRHGQQPTTEAGSATQAFSIQRESLFHAYTLLNRLLALMKQGDLTVDTVTLQRLAAQLMQATTIPFHGEPVQGLQVMGVLETRSLDFRHLLILSAGEGNIPKGVSDTSFIPYALRKAYALTTADHKVAIYSYYFHRLLQRAEDITIVYNNSTSDGQTGEMSRFILQLMVEDQHHHIGIKALQASQKFIPFRPKEVEKTTDMVRKLTARFAATAHNASPLTPSAINRYLRCPLIFYYTYIHDLREPDDDNDDDVIDNRIFGNIFHEAAQTIYTRLTEKSRQIAADDLEQMLRKKVDIERAVDQAISKELFHLDAPAAGHDLSGLQLINRAVIIHYLRQLLSIDRRLAPFTIEGLETDVAMDITIGGTQAHDDDGRNAQPLTISVGGRIDRLDKIVKDGREQIRVIDYKTGSHVPTPLSGVEAIFDTEQLKNHSDYYLQTFLYSLIVGRRHPGTAVSPALLFIQHAGADDYSPVLKFGKEYIDDVARHADTFMEHLTALVGEIFSPDISFAPTPDRTRCAACPYRLLCLQGAK